ncbi:hypothetical protein OH807_20895 [Kitasatospora sp. NBC_01560]|uniref:hypothetical protein n=1 Tax=Kitasatospora sp. NBC_01560 TaxID=2975965 RepID=UPI00386409EE
MSTGTVHLLIGAALLTLLALAFATVALGVVATLRMPRAGADSPSGREQRQHDRPG